MRCGRKNCFNRADFATNMQKKRDEKGSNENSPSSNNKNSIANDFKIALAALTSAEDYASLEDQFFQLKD